MSNQTGELEYQTTVDDRRGRRELERWERRVEKASGSQGKLANSTEAMSQRFNQAESSVAGAATAMSGLNSAMGGTVQGASDVTGAVANLAGAFKGGGPWALAMAAAGAGIGVLINKWQEAQEKARKAREESENTAKALADQIRAATEQANIATLQSIAKIGGGIVDPLEVKAAQAEAKAKDLEAASRQMLVELDKAEAQEARLGIERARAFSRSGKSSTELRNELKGLEEQWAAASKVADAAALELDEYKAAQDRARAAAARAAEVEKERAEALRKAEEAERRAKQAAEERRRALQKDLEEELAIYESGIAFRARREAKERRAMLQRFAEEKREELRLEKEKIQKAEQAREAARKAREAKAKAEAATLKAAQDDLAQTTSGLWEGIANQAAGTLFQVFDSIATGSKLSARALASQFTRAIGQQLVGIGIKESFAAAFEALNPVTAPVAAARGGLAAFALTTGIAMGGVGAALAPRGRAAGGGGSAGLSSGRGAAGRGGSSAGAPTIAVTYNYGVASPNRENEARMVAQVQRDGDRLLNGGLRRGNRS